MGKTIINGMSRRNFMGAGLGLAAGLTLAGRARAQAQLQKEAVNYQEEPNGDQRCDNCSFWLPGDTPEAIGGCSMVVGEIAPDAWCAIWAPAA